MKVELTESEIKTLKSYLHGALIDPKGFAAIGYRSKESVKTLNLF